MKERDKTRQNARIKSLTIGFERFFARIWVEVIATFLGISIFAFRGLNQFFPGIWRFERKLDVINRGVKMTDRFITILGHWRHFKSTQNTLH